MGGNKNIANPLWVPFVPFDSFVVQYRKEFFEPQKAQKRTKGRACGLDLKSIWISVFSKVLYIFLLSSSITAQEVTGSLAFSQKNLTLGEVVPVRMEVTHPDDVVLIFPDSTYDISPFEWVRSVPEPTVTENGISKDAITYFVRTLGLQEKLVLRLSYSHVVEGDTFRTYEESDTIALQKQVLSLSPAPPFRGDNSLIRVPDPPNYLLMAGIGLAVISLLVLLAFALRKPLRRYMARRRLQREWLGIQRSLRALKKEPPEAAKFLESLNHIWKDYLDPKGQYALRSLTTTELPPVLRDMGEVSSEAGALLLRAAAAGDKVIYAGQEMAGGEVIGLLGEVEKMLEKVYAGRVPKK